MINRALAKSLVPFLETLSFKDRLSGLVKTIEKKDYSGTGKRPTFPGSPDANVVLQPTEYADMSPNNKFKSVVYFEDYGCKIVGQRGPNVQFESLLRLVCWLNLEKAELGELALVHELLGLLPTGFNNSPGLQKVIVAPTRIMGQEERLFSRYTFDETTRQFLMLPYGACALELKINFDANLSCLI